MVKIANSTESISWLFKYAVCIISCINTGQINMRLPASYNLRFNNLSTAVAFAVIKSYLETGKRHGYDVTELIVRALEGNYVTIEEMKKHNVLN